jgi:hypothetical protein
VKHWFQNLVFKFNLYRCTEASAFLWRVELRPGNSKFVARLQYALSDGSGAAPSGGGSGGGGGGAGAEAGGGPVVMTMHFMSSPRSPTVSGLDIACGGVSGGGGGGGTDEVCINPSSSPASPWRGYVSGLYAALPAPALGAPRDALTRDAVLARRGLYTLTHRLKPPAFNP